MKHTKRLALPLFMLAGGPKNVPLMLEQSGRRYATMFTSEASVCRFQQASCSLNSYQLQALPTSAEVRKELETTRKFGCSLLLIDPLGPEINDDQAQLLAVFLRQLPLETAKSVRKGK